MVLQSVPTFRNDDNRAMNDEPLPPEIIQILDGALNPTEAAGLLAMYRHRGISAAVRKGLWLNKNRSPEGYARWLKRPLHVRKGAKKHARRVAAEAILAEAIAAART